MCNQYQQPIDPNEIGPHFEADVAAMKLYLEKASLRAQVYPRYAAVAVTSERKAEVLSWGFSMGDKKQIFNNAKAETVDTLPLFKGAFAKRRCLIPGQCFVEHDRHKQKYVITLPDTPLFAFAGIWRKGEVTMLTCAPNVFMERIHNRMPVIVRKAEYDRWLIEGGKDLLVPYPGEMNAVCVKGKAHVQEELF